MKKNGSELLVKWEKKQKRRNPAVASSQKLWLYSQLLCGMLVITMTSQIFWSFFSSDPENKVSLFYNGLIFSFFLSFLFLLFRGVFFVLCCCFFFIQNTQYYVRAHYVLTLIRGWRNEIYTQVCTKWPPYYSLNIKEILFSQRCHDFLYIFKDSPCSG